MFTVLKSLLQNARMDDAKLNKCKKLKTVNTRLTNSWLWFDCGTGGPRIEPVL